MDLKRKHWNDQQKLLAEALKRKADHARALGLFLPQHAAVHASGLGEPGAWSFDEELWQDLPQAAARRIPTGGEHSIAWLVWHMARCEDITFNLLVAGCPQVIDEGGWMEKTRATVYDTGNAMNVAQVARYRQRGWLSMAAGWDARRRGAGRLAIWKPCCMAATGRLRRFST